MMTAYMLEAVGTGGKAGGQPKDAVLYVTQNLYNEAGETTGSRLKRLLLDENGRPMSVSWQAVLKVPMATRTANKVTEAVRVQCRYEFMNPEYPDLADAARMPLMVTAQLKTNRETIAKMRGCAPHQVDLAECAKMLKEYCADLAPWVNDDGTFKPAPKATAKKTTKKK